MIMAIVSAQPLVAEPDDYLHVGVATQGKDQGKYTYINTRWVKKNHKTLFSGEGYEETLVILQNEINQTPDLIKSLSGWFDESSILTLNPAEVHEFNDFYNLIAEPEVIPVILEEAYDKDVTIGRMMLLNQLDMFIELTRIGKGGK